MKTTLNIIKSEWDELHKSFAVYTADAGVARQKKWKEIEALFIKHFGE